MNNIKNLFKPSIKDSDLSFCDLREGFITHYNGLEIGKIPIIIVKKKNGVNKSSTYYAFNTNGNTILAEGIGKKEFYDILKKLKDKVNVNVSVKNKSRIIGYSHNNLFESRRNNNTTTATVTYNRKSTNNDFKNAILATKIIIFFKTYWSNNKPFSEEFYDLNNYFMSMTH